MTSENERERKSATVRARIEPSLKEAAERILDGIGLDRRRSSPRSIARSSRATGCPSSLN
jgi:hypothetical protein